MVFYVSSSPLRNQTCNKQEKKDLSEKKISEKEIIRMKKENCGEKKEKPKKQLHSIHRTITMKNLLLFYTS